MEVGYASGWRTGELRVKWLGISKTSQNPLAMHIQPSLYHTLGTGCSPLSMPLRVESRLWTLGVMSCEIRRTLPSPNAIVKPPVCGLPKIVGADVFLASCRGASPPKRVLLLE